MWKRLCSFLLESFLTPVGLEPGVTWTRNRVWLEVEMFVRLAIKKSKLNFFKKKLFLFFLEAFSLQVENLLQYYLEYIF